MKNSKFLVPILMVALLGGSIYKTYSDRSSLNNEYKEDIELARQNRKLEVWVNAEDYYLKAINLKDSADTRVELGQMYVDAGDLRTAAKWGESIVDDYPKEAVGYEYLIEVYLAQKDYGSCFEVSNLAAGLNIASEKINEVIADIAYQYYLEGEYADASNFSNGYAAVMKDERWGYVNSKGKRVVNSQFVEAGPFASEVAAVIDENGKAYYIDSEGNRKIVIDFIDNVQELGYMTPDNIFSVKTGDKWSFYNLDTQEKIAGDYDEVSTLGNGAAAVKDKWKLIGSDGKAISKNEYDSVVIDSKGIVCRRDRIFVEESGSYYMIDSTGKKVCKTSFEDAKLFNAEGYAAVKIDGKWGFIDENGDVVIKPEYIDAGSFSNGLAAVKMAEGWGYIDMDNNKVITDGFEEACDFNELGKAFVKADDRWQLLSLYSYNH